MNSLHADVYPNEKSTKNRKLKVQRKTLQIAKIRRFQLHERQHTTFQVKIR